MSGPIDQNITLAHLGWDRSFAAHIPAHMTPMRITQVHRNKMQIMGEIGTQLIPLIAGATVGDWVLFNVSCPADTALLPRHSLFERGAAGHARRRQLIAANVDTGVVVSACNADFNLARLERYCALVLAAGSQPVIALTKSDLCPVPSGFIKQAQSISPQIPVMCFDARHAEAKKQMAKWGKTGATLAFLGSSGVGKSTLLNTLCGNEVAATNTVRTADAKGRHTTTGRRLYPMAGGFCVIDMPGMREVQLYNASHGIAALFRDFHDLAAQCRFNDCKHENEPDCAIQTALGQGRIDPARVARWKNLSTMSSSPKNAIHATV